MISRVGVCGSSVASDVVMTSRIAVVNYKRIAVVWFATVTVSVFVASTVDAVSFAAVEYGCFVASVVSGMESATVVEAGVPEVPWISVMRSGFATVVSRVSIEGKVLGSAEDAVEFGIDVVS